jgi:hypothetical protein
MDTQSADDCQVLESSATFLERSSASAKAVRSKARFRSPAKVTEPNF